MLDAAQKTARWPRADQLQKVGRTYDWSMSYLMSGAGDRYNSDLIAHYSREDLVQVVLNTASAADMLIESTKGIRNDVYDLQIDTREKYTTIVELLETLVDNKERKA